mgnify:CR=1 FL=1
MKINIPQMQGISSFESFLNMLWISLPAEHEGSALLWLWIIYAEGVNCHGFDLLFVKWSVTVVSVGLSNLVYHIHALGHFTKAA